MIYSLYYREGEERIYGADIPINSTYMKFIKLDGFDLLLKSLNENTQNQIQQKLKAYGLS